MFGFGWGSVWLEAAGDDMAGAALLLILGLIGEQVRAIAERTRNVPMVIEDERLGFPPGRERPSSRTFVKPITTDTL